MQLQCPVCGADVPDSEDVCLCGVPVSRPVPTTPSAQPMPPVSPTPAIGSGPGVGPRLEPRDGGAARPLAPLGTSILVGRYSSEMGPVDLDLGDQPNADYVSRHHALLYEDGGTWFVKDLGSSGGTFVRALGEAGAVHSAYEKVMPDRGHPLGDGTEIAFAKVRFVFRSAEQPDGCTA